MALQEMDSSCSFATKASSGRAEVLVGEPCSPRVYCDDVVVVHNNDLEEIPAPDEPIKERAAFQRNNPPKVHNSVVAAEFDKVKVHLKKIYYMYYYSLFSIHSFLSVTCSSSLC